MTNLQAEAEARANTFADELLAGEALFVDFIQDESTDNALHVKALYPHGVWVEYKVNHDGIVKV